jgi:predicted nucleotide-binding protein
MALSKEAVTILLVDDQQDSADSISTLLSNVMVTSEMKTLGDIFRFVGLCVDPQPRGLVERVIQSITDLPDTVAMALVDLSFDNENRPEAVKIGRRVALALRDAFPALVIGVYTKHRLRLRERTLVASDGFPVYLEELRLMLDGSERLQGDDWYEIFMGAIAGRKQTLRSHSESPLASTEKSGPAEDSRKSGNVNPTLVRRKPRLFIGSSVEALPLANAIQENLDYLALSFVWDQITFQPTYDTLHSLIRQLESVDFAVFVLAPSDIAVMRGTSSFVVRDNVLFELGLFIGRIGRDRTFMVAPRDVDNFHLPSDLWGLQALRYDGKEEITDDNARALVGAASNSVKREIRRIAGV